MFVCPQHQPKIPTTAQHTPPNPHKQQIHKTPVKTNANQSSIVEKDQRRVPKSADGTQVKRRSLKKKLSQNSLLFKMQNERTHTGQMHQQVTEDQTRMPSWRIQRPTEKE